MSLSLSPWLALLRQTTNWFGLGGAGQLIKQWNGVGGGRTNTACAWKGLRAFLLLALALFSWIDVKLRCHWYQCYVCYDAWCLLPGKKGIILFFGSFCPPSIGNLSRMRICSDKEINKYELRNKTCRSAMKNGDANMLVIENVSFNWARTSLYPPKACQSELQVDRGIWELEQNKRDSSCPEQCASLFCCTNPTWSVITWRLKRYWLMQLQFHFDL